MTNKNVVSLCLVLALAACAGADTESEKGPVPDREVRVAPMPDRQARSDAPRPNPDRIDPQKPALALPDPVLDGAGLDAVSLTEALHTTHAWGLLRRDAQGAYLEYATVRFRLPDGSWTGRAPDALSRHAEWDIALEDHDIAEGDHVGMVFTHTSPRADDPFDLRGLDPRSADVTLYARADQFHAGPPCLRETVSRDSVPSGGGWENVLADPAASLIVRGDTLVCQPAHDGIHGGECEFGGGRVAFFVDGEGRAERITALHPSPTLYVNRPPEPAEVACWPDRKTR